MRRSRWSAVSGGAAWTTRAAYSAIVSDLGASLRGMFTAGRDNTEQGDVDLVEVHTEEF